MNVFLIDKILCIGKTFLSNILSHYLLKMERKSHTKNSLCITYNYRNFTIGISIKNNSFSFIAYPLFNQNDTFNHTSNNENLSVNINIRYISSQTSQYENIPRHIFQLQINVEPLIFNLTVNCDVNCLPNRSTIPFQSS